MAGPANKTSKKKEKPQGSQPGYGDDPACPPEVIQADDLALTGDLAVTVYAGEEPGQACPLTDDSVRLSGVAVTVTGDCFNETRLTDVDGVAFWDGIPLQDYTVTAAPPSGYGAGQDIQVDLANDEDEAEICLPPEAASLDVVATHGQELVGNVGFQVFDGDEFIATGRTGADGKAHLDGLRPGLLAIQPQTSARAGGRLLRPAFQQRLMARLDPGQTRAVSLPYVSGLGELRVSALLELEGGEDCDAEQVPLTGVGLDLYTGATAHGIPVRKATTQTSPNVFSDLQAGHYTLVVRGPARNGSQAIELADLRQSTLHVDLTDGGSVVLPPLLFRSSLGRVEGCVRDAATQRGWTGIRILLLPTGGGTALETRTQADGDFVFRGVPPGAYDLQLAETKVADPSGRCWVLADGVPARQRIVVGTNGPVHVRPLLLSPEEHLLTVQVFDPRGSSLAGAEVEIQEEGGASLGTFVTDAEGQVVVHLLEAGTYRARVRNDGTTSARVVVNEPQFIELHMHGRGGWGPTPPPQPGPTEAVVDIPYPLLTEGVTGGGGWSSSSPAPALDLGSTVEKTLRDVLGWKSRGFKGNAKGFLEALNQSFELREVEGHTEFIWNPRSYTVQTDLGTITGAQASIYSRAKVFLDESLPLLDGLYPLRPDADDQDTEAIRSIVRSGFTELVNELGLEGGPRVVRVDDLFEQLLGVAPGAAAPADPETAGGQLGNLASLFGLRRGQINTIEEEQNLTNYLIVVDYVIGLYQSWRTQRAFFGRGGGEPFLGTQLVLVSRALNVVAESVQEVYAALDSVFVGPAERQVIELRFAGGSSLFVAELLDWIDQVASKEGPQLIQDGGKAGVRAFQPTIQRLAGLAQGALAANQPGPLPSGYRSARVQRALQELAGHLSEAARLAGQIRQAA